MSNRYSFCRVAEHDYESWDGRNAVLLDHTNNKWIDYHWEPKDRLLFMLFYTSDSELQHVEIVSARTNPLRDMWEYSEYRDEEVMELEDPNLLDPDLWEVALS